MRQRWAEKDPKSFTQMQGTVHDKVRNSFI